MSTAPDAEGPTAEPAATGDSVLVSERFRPAAPAPGPSPVAGPRGDLLRLLVLVVAGAVALAMFVYVAIILVAWVDEVMFV